MLDYLIMVLLVVLKTMSMQELVDYPQHLLLELELLQHLELELLHLPLQVDLETYFELD
jgi:hypothetical protein